jgi:N-acyl-D-aspartate/D-glutamate deacylase
MHDLVIRDAKIVDGTGAPAFAGDIAIDGERIAQVGGKAGPGRREIGADGLLATPGWVDVHTHYDGQATWDPILAPSSWNGVTSIIFGNCGVGFAPVRAEHHEALIQLMDGVEDIPGIALAEGLKWNWRSFPEYLDALDALPRTINIGSQVPHHPLRVFVMGERAIRRELATPEDIEAMSRLVEEAIGAGAFGFTTSRTDQHKTSTGAFVPARYADVEELLSIGRAMGRAGRGAFGLVADFTDEAEEFAWMTQFQRETGLPMWFLMTDRANDPTRYGRILAKLQALRDEQDIHLTAQVSGRPIGVLLSVSGSMNPFSLRPSFARLAPADLSPAERFARLRDPEVRRILLSEAPDAARIAALPPVWKTLAAHWANMYLMSGKPNYEPPADTRVTAVAARLGVDPQEVAYDHLAGGEDRLLFFPVANFNTGDLEPVRHMLLDPNSVLGMSDAGAHCGALSDASIPTFMLTHWARDRHQGAQLGLERVVRMQTKDTADYFGVRDRGELAAGRMADINLIDFDRLGLHMPEIAYDLPGGGRRFVQRADGYEATLVAGQTVFEKGQHTGALPGVLMRSGRGA